MDDTKRCFTYCGDDKCDCPARGFDRALQRRVETLELEVQILRARVKRHRSETTVFGPSLADRRRKRNEDNCRRIQRITDAGGIAGLSLPGEFF